MSDREEDALLLALRPFCPHESWMDRWKDEPDDMPFAISAGGGSFTLSLGDFRRAVAAAGGRPMPDHVWARVERHAEARRMSFEAAHAELITIGFASSPAYTGKEPAR